MEQDDFRRPIIIMDEGIQTWIAWFNANPWDGAQAWIGDAFVAMRYDGGVHVLRLVDHQIFDMMHLFETSGLTRDEEVIALVGADAQGQAWSY